MESEYQAPDLFSDRESEELTGRMIGPYEVQGPLGHGGQGDVLLAMDLRDHRLVAIKRVRLDVVLQPRLDARMLREVAILKELRHPNLVRYLDDGRDALGPYLVTELIEGETLGDRIRAAQDAGRSIPWREACTWMLGVLEGLGHAHRAGVHHRDIKPGNVMLGEDGRPVLIDFGLASWGTGNIGTKLTISALGAPGTPEYLPPERLRGDATIPGHLGDIYACGLVLFETLTGSSPFRRPTPGAVDSAIRRGGLPLSQLRRAQVPELVADWIAIAAERDPERRFIDAGVAHAELVRATQGRRLLARRVGWPVRLRRWAAANPAAMVVMGTMLSAAGVSVFWQREARAAEQVAESKGTALEIANRDLTRQGEEIRLLLAEALFRDDLARADSAIEFEQELWPLGPETREKMQFWLQQYGDLPKRSLAETQARLEAVIALAEPRTPADIEADRLQSAVYYQWVDFRRSYLEYATILRSAEILSGQRIEVFPEVREAMDKEPERNLIHQRLRLGGDSPEKVFQSARNLEKRILELEVDVNQRRTYRFARPENEFLFKLYSAGVAQLSRLDGPKGLVADVRQRLERAEALETLTVAGQADRWSELTRPDPRLKDGGVDYSGLVLTPEYGLIPLGRSPSTGLLEFMDLLSATDGCLGAERLENGELRPPAAEDGVVFVLIPGGDYLIGAQTQSSTKPHFDRQATSDECSVKEVPLAPFLISKYELTQAQWVRMGGTNDSSNRSGTTGSYLPDPRPWTLPVDSVSWLDARRILQRHRMELPTEAQWEVAYRAGTGSVYYSGDQWQSLVGHANLWDRWPVEDPEGGLRMWDDGTVEPTIVGSLKPNAWGLYDMAGNVGELCRDVFLMGERFQRGPEGVVQQWGRGLRPVRGGSFRDRPMSCRAVSRISQSEVAPSISVGLRPIRRLSAQ